MTPPSSQSPPESRSAWLWLLLGPAGLTLCNGLFLGSIALGGGYLVFFRFVGPVYKFNTLGLAVLFCLGGAMALLKRRNSPEPSRKLLIGSLASLLLGFLAAGTYYYATHFEPHRLVVRRVEIRTPKVSQRVRIVHATDIQTGAVGEHERRSIERMAEAGPDLFIFTGDLLQPVPPSTYESELPKVEPMLAAVRAPLGKFAVLGDVDRGPMPENFRRGIGGMRFLSNGPAEIVLPGGGKLRLFGLDLMESAGEGARELVEPWLSRGGADDFSIVFGHRPDFILKTGDLPVDLNLAGHTHGGQVRIPGFGPIVTLSHIPRDWARGFREIGPTRLNVSAGIGCERHSSLPKLRVFCPPEFTIIDLLPME